MGKKIEMDERAAGFVVIAVMIASLAWMMVSGITSANPLPVIGFSASLAVAMLFFGQWFSGEK